MSAFGFDLDYKVGTPLVGGAAGQIPWALLDMNFATRAIKGVSAFDDAFSVTNSAKYVQNSAGLYVPTAQNLLPQTDLGTLIEGGRTNSIRNNSMQGAAVGVVGSGGALPTNWSSSVSGLSVEVLAIGTENGIDTIDLRFFGTASATTHGLYLEASSIVTAAQSQSWAMSMFAKLLAAPAPATAYLVSFTEQTGGSVSTSKNQAFTPTSVLTRYSMIATTTTVGMDNIRPRPRFDLTIGQAYDFTLRIGWPQLELGSFVTSPIRTTNAAGVRASDNSLLSAAALAVVSGLLSGSAYIELNHRSVGGDQRLVTLRQSGTDFIRIGILTTNKLAFVISVGGVNTILSSTGSPVDGVDYKMAMRWAPNDLAVRFSPSLGAAPADVTSVPTPITSIGSVGIGNSAANSSHLNTFMKRAVLGPPQNNAELERLVA